MGEDATLEKRKESLKRLFFGKKYLQYVLLAILMIWGFIIRIKPLPNLIDITTGKYIPSDPDAMLFLRYAHEVLAHGSLSAVDVMRYYPFGYTQIGEFGLLSHVIVWLYKFLHLFNSSATLEYAHVIHPAVFFSLSLIFFFLLVKRLFDFRVGLLATAFLVVLPSYLFRTLAGVSDKESFAMFLMFAVTFYYVKAWQEEKISNGIFFGLISGILSGAMGLVWGGINFLFLIFGLFTLVEVVLKKFNWKDFFVYSAWLFSMCTILMTFFSERYTLSVFLLSVTSGFMFLAWFAGLVTLLIRNYNVLNLREKIERKIPLGVFSLIISSILGLFTIALSEGVGAILTRVNALIRNLLEPFGFTRWNLTVAESQQPYVVDWIGQWGWIYMILLLFGSLLLMYHILKNTRLKWWGTIAYTIFIFSFIFSRYSSRGVLNGVTGISKLMYLGSLLAMAILAFSVYIYSYKKDKNLYDALMNFDRKVTFVIIWFLVLTVAARGAIRLLHVYSPVTTILVAYALVQIYDFAKNLNGKYYRYGIYFILFLFLVLPNVQGSLVNMYNNVNNQATYIGPNYNQQWQYAMKWVRENTPKDAVFAHWWDYGYLVQTGGERATLTDGGNAGGYALNYFMGRHVLTAQSETEALEYLYARNATHLLMISDEIGKYPAYSSIGSDLNYDRYAGINTFQLDNSRTQEKREGTMLFYAGGTAFDEDFIYQEKLFPNGGAFIGAFLVPAVFNNDSSLTINQPQAIVIHAGQQYTIPLECIFVDGKEINFEQKGLPGCLILIPRFTGDQAENIGAALYVSPKVRGTLFTQLFLFGKEPEGFKVVYNDQQSWPLAVYNGRLIGPLKIWEMTYPKGLNPDPYYYGNVLPDPRVADV